MVSCRFSWFLIWDFLLKSEVYWLLQSGPGRFLGDLLVSGSVLSGNINSVETLKLTHQTLAGWRLGNNL